MVFGRVFLEFTQTGNGRCFVGEKIARKNGTKIVRIRTAANVTPAGILKTAAIATSAVATTADGPGSGAAETAYGASAPETIDRGRPCCEYGDPERAWPR